MNWLKRLLGIPIEGLEPGPCECEHERSCHTGGFGKCQVEEPADDKWPYGSRCACQVYIRASAKKTE
jgi:hypothetical protein